MQAKSDTRAIYFDKQYNTNDKNDLVIMVIPKKIDYKGF